MITEESKMATAFITGSARGIGAAIALRLAKDGFNTKFDASYTVSVLNDLKFSW